MHDLIAVTAGWGVIALGVAGLYVFGRDPKADEHDLSDYHEPAPDNDPTCRYLLHNGKVSLKPRAAAEDTTGGQSLPSEPEDILPPAPPGMRVSLPLYAEQVVAEQMRGRYGTTSPDVIAGRMLREIAGIRPAYATDRRDMTGAFPVVRAA